MSQTPEQRERSLQALRDLLAFLEARPEVPAPTYSNLYAFISRDDGPQEARFAALFDVADVFEADVTEDTDGDRKTERSFGPFVLTVFAQTDRKTEQRNGKRVVTRPTARPAVPDAGECLDERIESVDNRRYPQHVESDAERGICRNCGASTWDSYCSNPQPAAVTA